MGGLPIDAYAVEYKDLRADWVTARRRVWPAGGCGLGCTGPFLPCRTELYCPAAGGGYILEELRPATTYDLRFGSKNRVGFSEWSSGQRITMPRRGPPEPPVLNTQQVRRS